MKPSSFAITEPISFTPTSNSRCFGVCGPGMNSSLDTDCTGIGDGNSDSADESWLSSSGDSMLMEILLDRWRARGAPEPAVDARAAALVWTILAQRRDDGECLGVRCD